MYRVSSPFGVRGLEYKPDFFFSFISSLKHAACLMSRNVPLVKMENDPKV